MNKKRTCTFTTELRSDKQENPKIAGYFIRFDDTYDMGDCSESVCREALETQLDKDIRILIDHDSSKILGRTGAGTARLSLDDTGLYCEVDINPDDTEAMNAYRRVQRGDWNQASFGFQILNETQEQRDGKTHYTIKDLELYELSVVTFPAYQNTSLEARKKQLDKEGEKMNTRSLTEAVLALKEELATLKADQEAFEELKALLEKGDTVEEVAQGEGGGKSEESANAEGEKQPENGEKEEKPESGEKTQEEIEKENTQNVEKTTETEEKKETEDNGEKKEVEVEKEVVEEKPESKPADAKTPEELEKEKEEEEKKKKNRSSQIKNNFDTEDYNTSEKESKGMNTRDLIQNEETRNFIKNVKTVLETRTISELNLTVPDVMLPIIKEIVQEESKLLKYVTLKSIKGDARVRMLARANEALWTEACAKITNAVDLTYSLIEFDGYKLSSFAEVCRAYLEDNDVDLYQEVVHAIGQSIAFALDKAILYGKGTTKKMPEGICTSVSANKGDTNLISGTGKTGIDLFKELVEATAKVKNDYFDNSQLTYCMNTKTYTKLLAEGMSINATGNIVTGFGNKMPIIGADVVILEFIPDNNIVFGHFDAYYLVERKGIDLRESEDYHFLEDTVVFKGTLRADGKPVVPGAFACYCISGVPTTEIDVKGTATDNGNIGTESATE